jgi:hypothetical protein
MQLTFNTNLCGGKPLIVKEICISLQRFFFINNLSKFLLGVDFTAGGLSRDDSNVFLLFFCILVCKCILVIHCSFYTKNLHQNC